jgi:hypothetical protein
MPTQCQQCGATNPEAANFCRQCGASASLRGARSTTPDSPLLRQWRRLKFRMTRKEVRAILGEPAKIEAAEVAMEPASGHFAPATMERWLFEYALCVPQPAMSGDSARSDPSPPPQLRGVVQFTPPDGTVWSWTEPDWTKVAPNE